MVLVDYQCKICGAEFEGARVVEGKPVCPICQSRKIARVYRALNFELKGPGWSKDGYSKEVKKSAVAASS